MRLVQARTLYRRGVQQLYPGSGAAPENSVLRAEVYAVRVLVVCAPTVAYLDCKDAKKCCTKRLGYYILFDP